MPPFVVDAIGKDSIGDGPFAGAPGTDMSSIQFERCSCHACRFKSIEYTLFHFALSMMVSWSEMVSGIGGDMRSGNGVVLSPTPLICVRRR